MAGVGVAALLGLAGCGGSAGTTGTGLSPDAYGARLHSLVVPLFASLKQVGAAQSSGDLAKALRTSQVSVEAGIRTLSAIDAPAEAEEANAELLAALRSYETTIDATRHAVAHATTARLQTQIAAYNTRSRTFGQELIDVKQKLDSAGIHVSRPAASAGGS